MMNEKIEQAKQHFKRNKTVYISTGIAATIGVAGGFVLGNGGTQIVDSFKIVLVNWKSPHISQTTLIRRGHPGNIIKCIETGELFASQNRAADVMGISRSNLGKHLSGLRDNVGGFTFELIGEAQ